jgi:hypothetical protein
MRSAEVSADLAAVRGRLKHEGLRLVAHHRKMLRRHWPIRPKSGMASINVSIRADMSHDSSRVGMRT